MEPRPDSPPSSPVRGYDRPSGHLSPHYRERHREVLYRSDHDVGRMYFDRDSRDAQQRAEALRRNREERSAHSSPPPRAPSQPPQDSGSPSPVRDQPTSDISSPFDPLKSGSESPTPSQGSPRRGSHHAWTNTGDSPGARTPSPVSFKKLAGSQGSQSSQHPPPTTEANSDDEPDPPDLPPYQERVDIVRTSFPAREGMAESAKDDVPQDSVALGQHAPVKPPKPQLPWHPAHGQIAQQHQALLTGARSSTDDRANPALDRRSFLNAPSFNSQFYQIKNTAAEPSRTPEGFESLQAKAHTLRLKRRNPQKLSVDVPHRMSRDIDSQLRRALRAASYQEWFLGSTRILLETIAANPDQLSSLLPQVQGVLLSGAKASTDIHSVLEYLHHNWVLLRRDSYLETLDPVLSDNHVVTLRRHEIGDDSFLFDPEKVKETQTELARLKNERVVNQALRQGGKQGSPRQHQPQQRHSPRQSPRSRGGNHNNKSKWSPRSGHGKGKPSGHKDNNNNNNNSGK